jgi:acyl dehydratase
MLTVPVEKLTDYIDQPLGTSEWVTIDQDRINAFADVTLDHQFIHVDVEKARATPFGTTIAHGYLSLSLVSHFLGECGILPEGTVMAINYGSDKVRFLQPVAVNSKVRGHGKLLEVSEKSPGQHLVKTGISVEIEGQEKPALVAEILSMFIVQ